MTAPLFSIDVTMDRRRRRSYGNISIVSLLSSMPRAQRWPAGWRKFPAIYLPRGSFESSRFSPAISLPRGSVVVLPNSLSDITSPTASGKGLRRLAQCVWMAGCDCRVVVFFWIQL